MRRIEWPAYQCQADFLSDLAAAYPTLINIALQEREAVLAAFTAVYGPIDPL